jgi:hypothetical protein
MCRRTPNESLPKSEVSSQALVPLVVAWIALGELSLLGLAAVFPRYVFAVGPTTPWIGLSCLVVVWLVHGPKALAAGDAAVSVRRILSSRRRLLTGVGALVVGASAIVSWRFPAGVDLELLHPDGSHQRLGRRADFDLGSRDVLSLATYPDAAVHMAGYLSPGFTVPWGKAPLNVRTRWRVSARGVFQLRLNPHNRIDFDDTSLPVSGAVLMTDLTPQVDAIDLKFRPADTFGDGRMTVTLEDERLPWHLFGRPISTLAAWLIDCLRLLFATVIVFGAPVIGSLGIAWIGDRVARMPSVRPRMPLFREALAVCVAGGFYVGTLAPRVHASASGDQGAVLAWADYLERRQVVQPAPTWARWAGDQTGAFVALSMHLPYAETSSSGASGSRLVNEKPIGLPLVVLVSRAVFGEETSYFVPAGMAAMAVAALYAAARISGLGVVLSVLGAASLAGDGALLHGTTLLDPDVPTAACASVLLLAMLLIRRGTAWAAIAGAAAGLACLTRYNAALTFVLAAPFLLQTPTRILPFVLGGAPFLAALLGINTVAYGHPLAFPYATFVRQHMALALPYWTELGGYARAFVADLTPAAWLPFFAFPFIKRVPAVQRTALTLFVVAWFGFFGAVDKSEPFFLRYFLPIYPAVILGSLHVWHSLARATGAPRPLVMASAVALSAAWILPRALDEEPLQPDTSRVAAAWVDYLVPPGAAILTDDVLNGAVYYYTGRRHFPITLHVPRRQDVNTDVAMLKRAARVAGEGEDWFLLVPRWEMTAFQANYPELHVQLIHTGPTWQLCRIAAIEGAD